MSRMEAGAVVCDDNCSNLHAGLQGSPTCRYSAARRRSGMEMAMAVSLPACLLPAHLPIWPCLANCCACHLATCV